MKIRYLGTPGEDHEAIAMYGYVFPKGKDIEVTNLFAMHKLSHHPHFEAQPMTGTDKERMDLERELQDLTAAELKRMETTAEASKAEQAATAANLTDKDLYGNDERPGDADAAKAEGDSGERGARGGRHPKGG